MESKSEKRPRVSRLSLRDVKRSSRLLGKTAPKSDSNYQLNSTALERQTLYEFLLRSATGDMNLLKKVIFCNKRSFNLITRGHLLRLQKKYSLCTEHNLVLTSYQTSEFASIQTQVRSDTEELRTLERNSQMRSISCQFNVSIISPRQL